MNHLNYVNLVEETLLKQWENSSIFQTSRDDLTVGVALLTKIAVEAIDETSTKESESDDAGISSDIEPVREIADKIKEYVEHKASRFKSACRTGFPFSLLESSLAEAALKRSIENYESILPCFMLLEDNRLEEKELNYRFGPLFQNFRIDKISDACYSLARIYVERDDYTAGHHLLWFIKQATGSDYEIPDLSSFNDETVAEVLSRFMKGTGSHINTINLMEIFLYRKYRVETLFYRKFLDRESHSIFINFAIDRLQNIPVEQWPNKTIILTEILETESAANRMTIAKILISSEDFKTAEIGKHLLAALEADSLKSAVLHLYALEKLLPHFNDTHAEKLFNYPFIKFCKDASLFDDDPECVKRLQFNRMKKVFVHGSLMIGVYEDAAPYLLAFDMNTEKIVWGNRLKAKDYHLQRIGRFISLRSADKETVHFFRLDTGEVECIVKLPFDFKDSFDSLHISTEGFVYQMINKGQDRFLIGGKIIDKEWNPTFELRTPMGIFHPLSGHCGFRLFESQLVLFGPTGDSITLRNCMAAEAQGDKLYSVEKDIDNEGRCLLRIRTLKTGKEVVSGVEKTVSFYAKNASFGNFCKNGLLILFSGYYSKSSPIFIDLNSDEVTYSEYVFSSEIKPVVNNDTGEFWTWDPVSGKIHKVSSTAVTEMGTVEYDPSMIPVYSDKKGFLYFVDMN